MTLCSDGSAAEVAEGKRKVQGPELAFYLTLPNWSNLPIA